jgi:DNA invertase Pin-like site-specific DNA recombinase
MLETVDIIAAAGGGFFEQECEIDTTGPFGRFVFTVIAATANSSSATTRGRSARACSARDRGAQLGRPRQLAELGGTPGA